MILKAYDSLKKNQNFGKSELLGKRKASLIQENSDQISRKLKNFLKSLEKIMLSFPKD